MSKRLASVRRDRGSKKRQRRASFSPRLESLERRELLTTALQILHASDLEGGVDAIQDAPNFAAVVQGLENDAAGASVPSLLLSAGDNYIPGPFFSAASDPSVRDELDAAHEKLFGTTGLSIREGVGRADVTVMNILGIDASALGNHEFDPGTTVMREIIGTDVRGNPLSDVRWLGTQFPYLSANLDFSGDPNLRSLYADPATVGILENTAFQSTPANLAAAVAAPKLAPATIIKVDGQFIGVVGATTPRLEQISSPGGTQVKEPGAGTNDMVALAQILNPVIADIRAELVALNVPANGIAANDDIVILVSHLQQIQLEQQLVPLLNGVDVSIAGGSDTILANSGDRLRPGDVAGGEYPLMSTNADGGPVAIVSTDGQYSYVGRLVLEIGPGSVSVNAASGPYATDEQGVLDVWGNLTDPFAANTKGAEVKKVTDAVQTVVIQKDSQIFGKTDVYLAGRREQVRTEETNLGNLTADANLWIARGVDSTVAVSLKNGGGIRAEIGEVIETSPGVYEEVPPQANPLSGKETGEISQLDIENSLRFNNLLSLVTVTASELERILEHGVAATAPGTTPGQFPQVGGMRFSFDPSRQPIVLNAAGVVLTDGERIRSLTLIDEQGRTTDVIVRDGQLVGDPDREIRMVTLNFLAGGGDAYPLDDYGASRVDTPIGEQAALGQFLAAAHAVTPYATADTPMGQDQRIQNLSERSDTVLSPVAGPGVEFEHLSTLQLDGAEIGAYDPGSQQMYVTGGGLQIVDVQDPASPVPVGVIHPTFDGFNNDGVTSVAVARGIVATALPDATPENPGRVLFYTPAGGYMGSVVVGALPDMLTFTPDGMKLLVANEGEPGAFDPEGSVSVIDVSGLDPLNPLDYGIGTVTVTKAGFTAWDGREEELRNRGVRIFPDKQFSLDAEPEYISVAPNGTTAFVTLQEANAFAVLDLATKKIKDILPLGLKDHSNGQPVLTEYLFTDRPVLGTTATGEVIHLGGMSGLWFDGMTEEGNYKFLTIPDRGPNGDPTPERPFLLPDYQARVVEFELNPASGEIAITNQIYLTRPDGAGGSLPITGLPNIEGVDEVPVDALGNPLPYDPYGADLEGIVRAPDGTFWMCDEYRPAVYHFAEDGQLLARYVPQGTAALAGQPAGAFGSETLPAEYATRVANRGFEAIAYDTDQGLIYAFIQTPLANPDQATSNASTVIRMLGIDPASGAPVSEYVYLLEKAAHRENVVDKIGDAVYAGDGKFLVIERDSSPNPTGKKYVFEIDLQGATNLLSSERFDPYFLGGSGYSGSPATDSASAATAIATGNKTVDGNIAWLPGDLPGGSLTTIAESLRNDLGYSIGVVSTVPFSHATPAGFVSHNVSRNNYNAIASEIIHTVKPEVVIGGGNRGWGGNYLSAADQTALANGSAGYTYVGRTAGSDGGDALLAAAATVNVTTGGKLFGLFGGNGGNFEYHAVSDTPGAPSVTLGSQENPSLTDAVEATLDVLGDDPQGYFAMFEQGDIDWSNHANDFENMVGGMWDLDQAVQAAEAAVAAGTGGMDWSNTLILVTSDHSNSYMRNREVLEAGDLPQQVGVPYAFSYPGGEVTYGSTGHTNELVTLAARGAGADLLADYAGTWYPGTQIVDNSQIYDAMRRAAHEAGAEHILLFVGDGMNIEHEIAGSRYLYGEDRGLAWHDWGTQPDGWAGYCSTWDVTTYNRYATAFGEAAYSPDAFDPQVGYDPDLGGIAPYPLAAANVVSYNTSGLKNYFLPGSGAGYGSGPATDSASAATAMSTGNKTVDGNIAWLPGDLPGGSLTTIAETLRAENGYSIGVVSTVPFSHATPAAFVSHNVSRNNYNAIASEIINTVKPELVIGGGNRNWGGNYLSAADQTALANGSAGYTYVGRAAGSDGGDALLTAAATVDVNAGGKLFGLFGGVGGNFEYHLASDTPGAPNVSLGSQENPSLVDTVSASLDVLGDDPDGFFVMFEQGDIDWSNHANDFENMVGGVWDLDQAVQAAEAAVAAGTGGMDWSNTLVLVTSDHSNSYMRNQHVLGAGNLPQQVVAAPTFGYPGGEVSYATTGHTNELVTLAARGAGADLLADYAGSWYPGTEIVDNTHIYQVMKRAAQEAGAEHILLFIGDGMNIEHEIAGSRYLYGEDYGLAWNAWGQLEDGWSGFCSTWDVTTYNKYATTLGKPAYDAASFDPIVGYDPAKGGAKAFPLAQPEYMPLTGLTLEQHTADMLAALNIQPVSKVKVLNLPSIGYLPNDKPEGITLLPGGRIAVLNDNDFGLAGSDTVSLGVIDFDGGDGLDASDRDGAINVQNWPVFGMYMPDAVASFSSDGQTFYVTANEGDDRGENARIGGLDLDPQAFPNAADLQQAEALGRLAVSSIDGDLDGDGDFDRLQSYGARSFTIWDAFGNLVFDSSDQLELITANLTPELFNADEADPDEFDTRSDAKGPEPEGVTVGVIDGRTYAFVGLERAGGGVMIYDVTVPTEAQFVQYLRHEGDVAPEGLTFIPAETSPSGQPLLAVTNEESGTLTIYTIAQPLMVSGVTVNGGERQRSNIETMEVQFNRDANLAALIAAGTIDDVVQVQKLSNGGGLVPLDASRYRWDAASFTLTIDMTVDGFGGSQQTMLADGKYRLKLDTSRIWKASDVDQVLADTDGLLDGLYSSDFHRLLADLDGDRRVTAWDLVAVRNTMLGIADIPGADLNLDDLVDVSDLRLAASRSGKFVR